MWEGWTASSGTYLVIYRRHTSSTFSISVRRGWRSSGPARECEVEFADDAAALLVTKLGKVLVARPCAAPEGVDAPYIQPFQLRWCIACSGCWSSRRRVMTAVIGLQDVKNHVYISTALADYYAAAVDDVARDRGSMRWPSGAGSSSN